MKMAISYLLVVLALAMPIVLCHSQRMDDEDGPITYQSGELLYSNSCHIYTYGKLANVCSTCVGVCSAEDKDDMDLVSKEEKDEDSYGIIMQGQEEEEDDDSLIMQGEEEDDNSLIMPGEEEEDGEEGVPNIQGNIPVGVTTHRTC